MKATTAELAEQLEKKRYRAIFGHTLSFALWFGALIAVFGMKDMGVKPPMWALLAFGAVILVAVIFHVIYTFRLSKITGAIVRDPELRRAVNNEMYLAGDREAGVWGYYITLLASVVMFIVANQTSISALFATGVVLYAAALSAKVAQLIIHRD